MWTKPPKTCSLLGCAKPYHSNGLCSMHNYRQKHGIPLDAPYRFRMGRIPQPLDWAKCGTASQYRQHLRKGETPCEACRQAERRRVNDRTARRRRGQVDRRLGPCPLDCQCGRHTSQPGTIRPKCRPGCDCGKHFRTPQHNARIGISVSLTAEAKRYQR